MLRAQVDEPARRRRRCAHRGVAPVTSTSRLGARRRTPPLGLVAVLAAITCFSLGSTLVRKAAAPGVVVAAWRLLLGSAIWFVILGVTRTRPSASRVRLAVPAGIAFGLNLAFFFTAATRTRIANLEFITTLAPFVVLPLAVVFFGERVRPAAVVCGVVAVGGLAIVLLSGPSTGESTTVGNLLALASTLTWAVYLLLTKKVRPRLSTPEFMATAAVVATLVTLPMAAGNARFTDLTAAGWVYVILLAVLTGTVAHGLIVWAQKTVPVSTISGLGLAQPVLAVGWAWLFLGEAIEPFQAVGMAVVLGAVGVFARIQAGAGWPRVAAAR